MLCTYWIYQRLNSISKGTAAWKLEKSIWRCLKHKFTKDLETASELEKYNAFPNILLPDNQM